MTLPVGVSSSGCGEASAGDGVVPGVDEEAAMKVKASVKKICEKCKIIKRRGVVRVICENPRHKQRQG